MVSSDLPYGVGLINPGEGPYVTMASLCERILIERDGTYSAIRIVDRVIHTVRGTNPAGQMDPFPFQLQMLILKAGAAVGRATLEIQTRLPSGLTAEKSLSTIHFGGEERGPSVPVTLNLTLEYEGLYWFEVMVDGRLLTKVPLRVEYRPAMANPQA
jgi:hypothetical protein